MKIAIFENQYHQVKVAFEVANKLFFGNTIEFSQFNSTQEFSPLSDINKFDLLIIDISLSSNSDMDGFDLISEILKLGSFPKIIILTGNGSIEEGLEKRGLPKFPILFKPVDPIDIRDKIKSSMNL